MNYIAKKLDNGKIKLQARNNNRDLYYCLLTKGEAKELMTQLYRALNEEEQTSDRKLTERTERYCRHLHHTIGTCWYCGKGVYPVDCENCDKADWIEYTVTTTNQTTWTEKK